MPEGQRHLTHTGRFRIHALMESGLPDRRRPVAGARTGLSGRVRWRHRRATPPVRPGGRVTPGAGPCTRPAGGATLRIEGTEPFPCGIRGVGGREKRNAGAGNELALAETLLTRVRPKRKYTPGDTQTSPPHLCPTRNGSIRHGQPPYGCGGFPGKR